MEQIKILLVGAGGYAFKYISEFIDHPNDKVKLMGICDPYADKSVCYNQIIERKIPIYNTVNEFFNERKADLAVIVSPIQFHCEQSIFCLENGCNVLCEKPLCADIEQARLMREAELRTGRFIAVGYQLCFVSSIAELKKDIMSGKFGKPLEMKAIHMMRRGSDYYARNNWAGKIKSGNLLVCDSPFSNASAHQFHNMLFLLGKTMGTSTGVKAVETELYRANPNIENFDCMALRCETETGINVVYYTAHCVKSKEFGVFSEYKFENATITYSDNKYTALFKDGRTKVYDGIDTSLIQPKLYNVVDCINSNTVPICTVETATPHMQCVHMVQQNQIKPVSNVVCWQDGEVVYYSIPQLEEKLYNCYKQAALPCEIGIRF